MNKVQERKVNMIRRDAERCFSWMEIKKFEVEENEYFVSVYCVIGSPDDGRNVTSVKGGENLRTWLKELRISRNMTQKEMAKKLGITEAYYALIENGQRQKKMDVTILAGIAKATGTSVGRVAVKELAYLGIF